MNHVRRGGRYVRVADPDWDDPLSGEYSREAGGRWNPPASFAVVYLNDSVELARAQVQRRLDPLGISPEDLNPGAAPVLVEADLDDRDYIDAVSEAGLKKLGLPPDYPLDDTGAIVDHKVCRPIGLKVWQAGENGIACRSAAPGAPPESEELAVFGGDDLSPIAILNFLDWWY